MRSNHVRDDHERYLYIFFNLCRLTFPYNQIRDPQLIPSLIKFNGSVTFVKLTIEHSSELDDHNEHPWHSFLVMQQSLWGFMSRAPVTISRKIYMYVCSIFYIWGFMS